MHLIGSIIKKKEGDEQFIIIGKRWIHNSSSDKFFVYVLINFEGERCGSIESKKLFDDYIIIDVYSLEKVRANVTISYDYFYSDNLYVFYRDEVLFHGIYITKIEFNDKCVSFLHDMKTFRAFNKEIQLNLPIEVANAIFTYLGEEYRSEEELEERYKKELEEWEVKEFPEDFKKRLEEISERRINNIYYQLLLEQNVKKRGYSHDIKLNDLCSSEKMVEYYKERVEKCGKNVDIFINGVKKKLIEKYCKGNTTLADGGKYKLFSEESLEKLLIEFFAVNEMMLKER